LKEGGIVLALHFVQLASNFLQSTFLTFKGLVVRVASRRHTSVVRQQRLQLGAFEATLSLSIVLLLRPSCQRCLCILQLALEIGNLSFEIQLGRFAILAQLRQLVLEFIPFVLNASFDVLELFLHLGAIRIAVHGTLSSTLVLGHWLFARPGAGHSHFRDSDW
jgi:hypothetical protein